MRNVSYKTQLIDLLHQAHEIEHSTLAEQSETQRAANGSFKRWAAKDVIAHIAYWRERLTKNLAAQRRGEKAEGAEEFDEINAQVFEKNRDRTIDEIATEAERVFASFIAQVNEFSNEELTDPRPFGWYRERPLREAIQGNSYEHPLIHLSYFYLENGNAARAQQIQERMAANLRELDHSPGARGAVDYNLACFYALSGEPAKAISLLRGAFAARPDLLEWSKQDTDLDSLRMLPEYEALYSVSE